MREKVNQGTNTFLGKSVFTVDHRRSRRATDPYVIDSSPDPGQILFLGTDPDTNHENFRIRVQPF